MRKLLGEVAEVPVDRVNIPWPMTMFCIALLLSHLLTKILLFCASALVESEDQTLLFEMISPCDFCQKVWLLDRSPTFHTDCSSGCFPKQQAMATSIMKQCDFCHGVGHNDRTCAKKREWMAKKQQKAKAAKDMEDTSSVASMSTTVTIPSPETTPKPPVKLVQPVKPSSIALSESEEREARKIEKKLREIEALEKRLQQGRPQDIPR